MKHFLQILLLFWGVAASHRAAGQVIGTQAPAFEQPADHSKETPCGTPDITEEYLAAHPKVRERLAAIAEQTRQYVKDAEESGQKATGPEVLLTIPVVVHLLYNDTTQNLRDAVVHSQIDELNRAFRGELTPSLRALPFLSAVPVPFAARVGDARVQFCLATRDPDGNPTTGITRRDNTGNPQAFGNNEAMHRATGGTDAWNTAHYLNIWCYEGGGNTSVFPGTALDPQEDGILMNRAAFGRGSHTVVTGFTLGRLAVHEVGHWLNLRHLWGDADRLNRSCVDSDDVSDTPNQYWRNAGILRFPKFSCLNEPHGDMFMNHMDYTNDDIRLMFSRGQALRMQASFAPTTATRRGGYRESLRASPGLCPALGIASRSGAPLPTTVQAGNHTDYEFRATPFTVGCGGGTIHYAWRATGGWVVHYPNDFYPEIIPTGNSGSTITLTATYTNAQGFSFALGPVQHVVNYGPAGGISTELPDQSSPAATPVFTSAAAARCAGVSYAASVNPVAGATGYRWTVPAGFTYQGQPVTGPITTTTPYLVVAPTAALAGGVYLLQCQVLAPNRLPSAPAAVPLTVNGGPRWEIVDADPMQRTAQGIVCQRNRIFLELQPVGPTVPGSVTAFPVNGSVTWSSSLPLASTFTWTNTPLRVDYRTIADHSRPFTVTAEYTDACVNIVNTDPYIAITAPPGTTALSNGYSCGTYPWRQLPPGLLPSAPYPNPATGRLHLPGYQGPVVVYDHRGQPVQRLLAPATEAGADVDTSAWPEGIYVVTGRNLRGKWQRHNVQIQH